MSNGASGQRPSVEISSDIWDITEAYKAGRPAGMIRDGP